MGGNVGANDVFFKTLQDMHWNLFFPPSLTYWFKVKDIVLKSIYSPYTAFKKIFGLNHAPNSINVILGKL